MPLLLLLLTYFLIQNTPKQVHAIARVCLPQSNLQVQSQAEGLLHLVSTNSQRNQRGPRCVPSPVLLCDRFANPNGCWSTGRASALACTNEDWTQLSMVEQAQHIQDAYAQLMRVHQVDNPAINYSPRVMMCKTVRESCFRPQEMSSAPNSSAAGLSQVVRTTARDLFNRTGFRSRVHGFTDITSGDEFHDRMKTSILAQMELGLAVFHQKSRDNGGTRNPRSILMNYYGTSSRVENEKYADAIFGCANCIRQAGNEISQRCLAIARPNCFLPGTVQDTPSRSVNRRATVGPATPRTRPTTLRRATPTNQPRATPRGRR